jgi:4-amino-4-deoxy-L-arabinose transferase-like glycosyltransferase
MIQDRKQFLRLAGLFLFALAIHLAGTWILPLVDRDETWYAEVSREMNQRGDYIVAYFNNGFWLEKPPMLYWCQSAAYKIFGANEFAARFPAALAAALTALVIFGFCTRLYGRRTAWRAAFAFTLCFEMIIFGKAGVTDMPAVLFVTLASWAGWELVGTADASVVSASVVSKTGWWWMFYISLAAAFLAKGPVAVLPVGGLLVYWRWARVPGIFHVMKFGRGFAITGVLVALWFVPAVIETQGEYFKVFIGQQVLNRTVNPMDGHGGSNLLMYVVTLPFYLVTVLVLFFPWSIYFPGAIRRFKRERSPADIYLVSGILVTFTLFSLVRTKLPHYTLPAFPLIACAIAPILSGVRFLRWAVVMAVLNLTVAFVAFPLAVKYSVMNRLANDPAVRSDMAFASVDYHEPGLIWNFRKHLRTWDLNLKTADVQDYMHQNGPRLCILPSKSMSQITVAPEWQVVNARGFNITKGRMIDLSMLVKSQ